MGRGGVAFIAMVQLSRADDSGGGPFPRRYVIHIQRDSPSTIGERTRVINIVPLFVRIPILEFSGIGTAAARFSGCLDFSYRLST